MTDQPAFRELGKIAERWLDLAERRRDHFAELYRSGRWRLYYQEDVFRAQAREVARICDHWASILERHKQLLTEPQDSALQLAELEKAEPEAAVIDRDAA
ncbi:MAG TPA: TIGR03809 family protein [Xanthobacteraceae bacterium]|nr:TIGR03809 family protein [Xanthobacteraceae bacterium]